jgi:NADPH2:quinone reductase
LKVILPMRTIQVTRFGGPEVLRLTEAPDVEPGAGELLVHVAVSEVLFLDTQLRAGWGGEFFDVQPPFVPGAGVAGSVLAVGDGADPRWVGKRVIAGTSGPGAYAGGGYAERATVAADGAHEVPAGLDLRHAIAARHDGVMGVSRRERAALQAGDVALVTAAGGAIGTWLIPLLKRDGVIVIAAARGEHKLSVAAERGADVLADYGRQDWLAAVGREVDAVFDGTGGAIGTAAVGTLRRGGRFFSYGAASGEFADIERQAGERDVELVGIHEDASAEKMHGAAATALQLLAGGVIEPVIGQVVPLERAAEAHAAIAARTVAGKTLLTP